MHTAITGAVHQGRRRPRCAPMAFPDRRIAVERRYAPHPEPHHPRRLYVVAPRTHTRRDPRRVRRCRRRRFVHRKRAFFMLQRRLGRVEKCINEYLRRLRPIRVWKPPHVKRYFHLLLFLLLYILAFQILFFVLCCVCGGERVVEIAVYGNPAFRFGSLAGFEMPKRSISSSS
jgi:hypothetical protein